MVNQHTYYYFTPDYLLNASSLLSHITSFQTKQNQQLPDSLSAIAGFIFIFIIFSFHYEESLYNFRVVLSYNLNFLVRSFKFSAMSAKFTELLLISSIELAACSIVAEVS